MKKQYIRQVRKDLHIPRSAKAEVVRDLQEIRAELVSGGYLRQTDRNTKVLILSARSEVADKVAGLDAGANDYLTKLFHLDELAARIRCEGLQFRRVHSRIFFPFSMAAKPAAIRSTVSISG